MAERDRGFLSRWSRLKRAEREQRSAIAADPVEVKPAEPPAACAEPPAAPAAEATDPDADLPPIESLDRNSDYTAFMRSGVSPNLRRQALAKLWRSDPAFANLDGLLEYGEDFSLPFKQSRLVSTLYQVGRGMVDPLPEDAPAEEVAADSTAPTAETGTRQAGKADSPDANTGAGEAARDGRGAAEKV